MAKVIKVLLAVALTACLATCALYHESFPQKDDPFDAEADLVVQEEELGCGRFEQLF